MWLQQALMGLGIMGLFTGVGFIATTKTKSLWHKPRSCYISGTKPYRYPLPRPVRPRKTPLKPDWVRRPNRPFMRGVSLGLYFKRPDYDYDKYLYDIAKTGAGHVAFVVSWYQRDVKSTELHRHPKKTVSDARLVMTIRQARARGLQVFLLPIIRLEQRGPDDWRGVIKPKDLDAWWRSYRGYILHYAQLAQRHGVDLFSVGSELVSMETHRWRWQALIQAVRGIFPGSLTYSANWDHYEPVTFWDSLDYIGISNYYELSKKKNPPISLLRKRWTKIRHRVENWKRKYPRQPLIFTEVGYYSQLGTNIYPWDYTRDQPLSIEEQRRCYRAFVDVWSQSPVLQGVFFWNWFGGGGPRDKGYSPRGKPAECIMRDWFSYIRKKERKASFSRWIHKGRGYRSIPARAMLPAQSKKQLHPAQRSVNIPSKRPLVRKTQPKSR
ncbi:MAG TPA: hypothetical protein DCE42_05465 [Myxococcales bacterium]|nr:hypothetical protein [Deltaproteobacteria bacterium]MBU48884.1 hypothetical protein [Deltaproteobacteria bacterium]HAA54181.1 hypothetical protein [Myxococcales bacterium]